MSWRDRLRTGLTRYGLVDDVRSARHWVRSRGGRTDRTLIEEHLASTDTPRLHVGCGTRVLDGWLNADFSPRSIDAIRIDATRPLPFPDDTFQFIYSEHMIEHIDHQAGVAFAGEVARVLRPGGRFRVATPDLDRLLSLFVDPAERSDDARRYIQLIIDECVPGVEPSEANPVFVLNNNVREWGHTFLYDGPTLRRTLDAAGFVDVDQFELQESEIPDLRDLANESRMPPGLVAFETMTFEASAP